MIGAQQQKTPREVLADHGQLLVRRVIDREDHVSEAFFEVATEGRREWTQRDWNRFLYSLAQCDQTIDEWIETWETTT